MTSPPLEKSSSVEPIVVRVRAAQKMLGGRCRDKIYELINSGDLVSYRDGKARLITTESIKKYVDRMIAGN